ncbi:hypothetical protein ACSLPA_33855, partial [Escherichia coli]
QKIEQAAFNEAVRNDMSPGDAVREVARRMDAFASLITSSSVLMFRRTRILFVFVARQFSRFAIIKMIQWVEMSVR